MDHTYSTGPYYISLIVLLVLATAVVIWVLKVKNKLKRLQIVLSILALILAHFASQRNDDLDKQKRELLYKLQDQNAESTKLILDYLSNDTTLIAYYAFIGIIILLVAYLEINIRDMEEQVES